MFLRIALIALVILEAVFVGTTRDNSVTNTPPTNPFTRGCCSEQSYPSILEPGSSGSWSVTVFPRYYWNQYDVEVTPLPMIETLGQDRIVGSVGFSPTTALLGNVTDVFKNATFTLSVPNTAEPGYYIHTTMIRYKTLEGVTQAYNYTAPVKISALLDPKMLTISGALNSSFLEASLKTTNGGPAANALVELCGFKASAYGEDLLVMDARPTNAQGLSRFPAQEVKGLTHVLIEYTHSYLLCQGTIGATSYYVGASVDLPPGAGPLPNIIVALSSSFTVISLAAFWSVRRTRQTTVSREHAHRLPSGLGPWVPVLGLVGGLWGLVTTFILAFGGAMGCQQGICPTFPNFEGIFFLAMFGCSLAALVASGLTLILGRAGSLSLLIVGSTMWTTAILYYATLPEYWLPSEGTYHVIAALFFSVWIIPIIGAGLFGLDQAGKRRAL